MFVFSAVGTSQTISRFIVFGIGPVQVTLFERKPFLTIWASEKKSLRVTIYDLTDMPGSS